MQTVEGVLLSFGQMDKLLMSRQGFVAAQLLESFPKQPLSSQILIGFAIWLLSVIVPTALFWYVVRHERLLKTFLKGTLPSQVSIGLAVWFVSVIVPAALLWYVAKPEELLETFLKRPFATQIVLGVAVWLVSVIVRGTLFFRLLAPKLSDVEDDTGGFGILLTFFFVWPPAWPFAAIVVLLSRLTSHR